MFNERLTTSSVNFTLYPLIWLAAFFTAGILTAKFLFFGWRIYLITCLVSAILSVVFIRRKIALTFLPFAFIAVGGLIFTIENQSIAGNRVKTLYDTRQIMSGDPIEISGVLQSRPELAAGGFFL